MVDETVMPSLVKLLRRGESNVSLLLEYLECHQEHHDKAARQGWFNEHAREIVCDIFTYSNDSTKSQQLRSAKLLLRHTDTEIISGIKQKIVTQNQEAKFTE